MTDAPTLDIDLLRRWIGRREVAHDIITPRLAQELSATLDHGSAAADPGAPAPLAIHWCLAPPAAETAALGPDGHPARGGFLPPVPLPRRMWASSKLHLYDRLRIGDAVERRSTIADVTVKVGRSGTLCFVDVDHETASDRGLAVAERQTIVYRAMEKSVDPSPAVQPSPLAEPSSDSDWRQDKIASTTLLFRYSALTFNGHRIHYDHDYARQVEGYPGLVVHGPLQATQLLDFAAAIREKAPRSFSFRGLRPLIDTMPYRLCAKAAGAAITLWIETRDGVRTTQAEAEWDA